MTLPPGKCTLCSENVPPMADVVGFRKKIACANCGTYILEDGVLSRLEDFTADAKVELSHTIRDVFEATQESVTVTPEMAESHRNRRPASPAVQFDRFVLWLGRHLEEYGDAIELATGKHSLSSGSPSSIGFPFSGLSVCVSGDT